MQTEERVRARVAAPIAARPRRHRFGGGASGNDRLTSITGAVLLVLLAVEGATIPFLRGLLTVHVFVGMLLLGPVALKLASTGYRFLRYYGGRPEYVRRGPPAPAMRFFVAPVLVASTVTLFGTGVGLIAFGPGRGLMLGLHKASFIVWFGAMAIHVLAYLGRAMRHAFADYGSHRIAGVALRHILVAGALVAGIIVAVLTLPLAGPWHHWRH